MGEWVTHVSIHVFLFTKVFMHEISDQQLCMKVTIVVRHFRWLMSYTYFINTKAL